MEYIVLSYIIIGLGAAVSALSNDNGKTATGPLILGSAIIILFWPVFLVANLFSRLFFG